MSSRSPSDVHGGYASGHVWRLATALSGAASPGEVAVAVADCGALAAGAVFANMAIFNDRSNRVQVVHAPSLDPAIAQRWSEFGIDETTPLCEAILTGCPVLQPDLEAVAASYPGLVDDTVAAGLGATASIPLRSRQGPTIGAVGFGWKEPQGFTSQQMSRLTLIAQLSAEALERVRGGPPVKVATDRAEARVLQAAFLPASLPETEHLEVAAAYLPASDAPMGGDWYDAFSVDGGTCLVIGDVAGHGVEAVAVMAQLRNAVRAFADEDPTPQRVVTRVNRMVCRLSPDASATLIVAVWHPEQRTLIRTSAGHLPVLRCRAGEFGFLMPQGASGPMVGGHPSWEYGQETKLLRPGTTLLFYTDGLIETRGESLDISMERLRRFAETQADLSPHALCDDVLLWRLMQGPRGDDVCVVTARMT